MFFHEFTIFQRGGNEILQEEIIVREHSIKMRGIYIFYIVLVPSSKPMSPPCRSNYLTLKDSKQIDPPSKQNAGYATGSEYIYWGRVID